jgi:hypothetical protein
MDRGRYTEGQGKGHKRTRTGIPTTYKKIRASKALSLKKIDKIEFKSLFYLKISVLPLS